jgi:hypothetical protein
MKKTLLVHHTPHNPNYRYLCQSLLQHGGDVLETTVQPLHQNLFELFYKLKSNIVFLPAAEYTQEFHDFITEYHKQTQVVLLIDREIEQKELRQFWKDTKVKLIVDHKYASSYDNESALIYNRLYNSDLFFNRNLLRNNKVAVILSEDTEKNHRILDKWLYPTNPQSQLVLFNNPSFRHSQNIGIFNAADLGIMLNTFSYLLDLDSLFETEAAVCEITNVDVEKIQDINTPDTYPVRQSSLDDLTQCSYASFVKNKLLSFLAS